MYVSSKRNWFYNLVWGLNFYRQGILMRITFRCHLLILADNSEKWNSRRDWLLHLLNYNVSTPVLLRWNFWFFCLRSPMEVSDCQMGDGGMWVGGKQSWLWRIAVLMNSKPTRFTLGWFTCYLLFGRISQRNGTCDSETAGSGGSKWTRDPIWRGERTTFVHLVRPDVIDLGFLYRNVCNNQNIL